MSTGRYSQRGFAFQSFAFRTWGLAGGGNENVTPGTQERISIEATSKRRTAIELTARNRASVEATGKRRLGVEV
jgi:hypothetical protein